MPDHHMRFIKLTKLCTVPRPFTRLHVVTFDLQHCLALSAETSHQAA